MDELVTYEVEVFVKDMPMYIVDVPTYLGPQAAVSRAVTTVWSAYHRDLTLDDIRGNIYEGDSA